MEIKAQLNKPYTEEQRIDFIVEQNHSHGYEIRETETALEAWGKTDDEKLKQAQTAKLQEASDKAFEYRNVTGLVSFNARPVDTSLLAEGETTLVLHTELLNQNDFFQRMVGFNSGLFTGDVIYNTKEDVLIYLNAEETQAIYYAIIDRAGRLWNEDYMTYKALIEGCKTAEEVEQIVIDYDNVPVIKDNDISIIQEDNTIMKGGE